MDGFYQNQTVPISVKHEVLNEATDTWELTPFDADYPKVTIYNPSGTALVTDAAMSGVSTGKYRYVYTLAADAPTGIWKARSRGKYTSGGIIQYPIVEYLFLVK